MKETDVAYVEFWAGGNVKNDGSDIRVINEKGKIVPFKIMFCGTDDRVIVAFQAKKYENVYWVYYGNQNASKIEESQWEPKAGLFLETRRRDSGEVNNWNQTRRMLNENNYAFGAGYRPKIFDGFNPYGPSDNYISIYTGYISCPTTGEYTFCTASDDASFLFINDKLVAQWPGQHGAGGGVYGQHNGKIFLKAGIAKMKYIQVEYYSAQAAVAGWKRPFDRYVSLIPDASFLPVRRAMVKNYEILRDDLNIEFEPVLQSSLMFHKSSLMAYKFDLLKYDCTEPIVQYYWDFNDGTTSDKVSPTHIYLKNGRYTPKLTFKMKDGSVRTIKQTVNVDHIDFVSDTQESVLKEKYAQIIKDYQLENLNEEKLRLSLRFLQDTRKYKTIIESCAEVLESKKNLSNRMKGILALAIVESYLSRNLPENAAIFLENYFKRFKEKNYFSAKLSVELANVYLLHLQKLDEAMKIFEEVEAFTRDKHKGVWLEALMGLGDCYREKGDYTNAFRAYSMVESAGKKSAFQGSYALNIEYYIDLENIEDALDEIDRWESEFPTEKIYGHSSVLRAKCYLVKKEYGKVKEIIDKILRINPETGYYPEAMMVLADSYIAQGEYREAISSLYSILKRFSDFRYKNEVEAKITFCRRKLGLE